VFQELLANKDRAVTAQRQGDGVRRTGVQGDDFPALVHPDSGVEGVFAQRTDNHTSDASVEAVDDVAEKIVRHWARSRGFLDLERDGVGFKETNPDGKDDFAGKVVEDHDGHLR